MFGKWGWMGLGGVGVFGFGEVGTSGYERGLTGFCGFVKIRVFVGISVFTRVLVYRTFVHFQGVFGEDFTQFLPNGYSTFVLTKLALEEIFLLRKILILGGFRL